MISDRDRTILEKRKLQLLRLRFQNEARANFPIFLNYCNPSYERKWFHTLIARKCQELLEGKIRKLMVFVPPQHGKSEIVSRQFPAFALGVNPNLKIVGSSYSSDLANQFSRAIQRTIDSEEYTKLFPNTYLNGSNIRTNSRGYLRNVDIFETVGYKGFYKAVGVCGGLTGTPVDIAIIDDPVKDAIEANSVTYRERVWDWYVNVLLTRLHNESRQIFIMTRWHDDDLAGRILKQEGDEWEVVLIPAIKENNDYPEDPRQIGEALWKEKHSLEKLRRMEATSLRTFTALYQQRPSIKGGNILKEEWFQRISLSSFLSIKSRDVIPHYFVDTAYDERKKKTDNDPTGIIGACKIGRNIYIFAATKVWKSFPDLIRFLPNWVQSNGYKEGSTLRIEPKANGKSVVQQLREETDLNVCETPPPTDSKEVRTATNSAKIECGRVFIVEGAWNDSYIAELTQFPATAHDEYVDITNYAIDYFLNDEIDIPDNIERILGLT
ncbi:MAG: heat-shock protein Hsp70 [Bacteroides sp.]|nr:heat-shock protein Hsp70 [Bacteroides sp.]